MTTPSKVLYALLAAAWTAGIPVCHATTTPQVVGAGPSTTWGASALGAYNQAGGSSGGANHATYPCITPKCYSQINDPRSTQIFPNPGLLWIVWSADETQAWAG